MNYIYEMLLSFYVRRDSFLPDPPLLLCVTWLISTRCSSFSVCDVTHAHEILLSFLLRWCFLILFFSSSHLGKRGAGACRGRCVRRYDSLRAVRERTPAEYSIAHAAAHVVTATIFDDGCTTVGAAPIFNTVNAFGKEGVFHPIPQFSRHSIVWVVPLMLAHEAHNSLLTPVPNSNARHFRAFYKLCSLGAAADQLLSAS